MGSARIEIHPAYTKEQKYAGSARYEPGTPDWRIYLSLGNRGKDMSADAWRHCPLCNNLPEEWRNGIDHLYGTVSREQFKEIELKYNELKAVATVREDYECVLNYDGTANFSFFAKCQNCGATWTMESRVSAEVDDGK